MTELSDRACAREAREERARRWFAWWLLAVVAILSAAAVCSPRVVDERARMDWRLRCR